MIDKTPKKINAKGISLISLTVAVCILIVLSSMMIYTTRNGIKIRAYKMLQNDIEILNDKINAYYVKYGALPAEIKYVNTNFTKNIDSSGQKGANDGEDYYVIDLKALEGVTLNYGADASKIQTEEDTAQYDDVYIINKESHHIYYARGINFDGVWYYTNDVDEEISLYEKKRWTALAEFETESDSSKKLNYYALDNRGELYIIDENYNGNIYENTNYEKFNDKYKNVIKGKKIVKTSVGYGHTVAIDEEGKVYIWGWNWCGLLGNGTEDEYSNVPICISEIEGNVLKGKRIVEISAGISHTVAIDEEGKVYTWGCNGYGMLGDGTGGIVEEGADIPYSNVPICISEIEGNILKGRKIVKIAVGNVYESEVSNTVAIDEEGKVYTWGINMYGLLGDGTGGIVESRTDMPYSNVPICISEIEGNVLNGKNIVEISAVDGYTVAIDEEGKVYTWGINMYGLLGDGTGGIVEEDADMPYSNVPICISEIEGNVLKGKKIVEISAEIYHTVAIDEKGQVYTWGVNGYGLLGDGTGGTVEKGADMPYSNVPICISEIEGNVLKGKKIVGVSAGTYHTVVIDEEGKVYTWGCNVYGILGDGTGGIVENRTDMPYSNVPICISEIEGNVLKGRKIVKVAVSTFMMGDVSSFTVATDEEGKVYTWGINRYGLLGDGTGDKYSNVPICISEIEGNALKGKNIVEILAGSMHTVAIDEEGKVYTWGINRYGLLGDGTGESGEISADIPYSNVPICISKIGKENVLEGKKIVGVSAGGYIGEVSTLHIAAIDSKGKVYTWGANVYGQLGDGTTEDSSMPICISEIEGNALNGKQIVEISAGNGHTVAIDKEGKVYTWGWNEYGQLGDGTTTNSGIPICISEIEGSALNGERIVEVSAGKYHTVAIDEKGQVYTWGDNYYGQLGNGTEDAYSNVPMCVSEIEGNALNGKQIVEISAGYGHTVAIDKEGKVYTWGWNKYGQLGDGTTTNSSMPICISEIEGSALNGERIVEVSVGEYHTVAIDEKGQVYTWGDNYYGQLGNGTEDAYSNVPMCVSGIEGNVLNGKNIVKAFAGEYSTELIDNKGNVIHMGKYKYTGPV